MRPTQQLWLQIDRGPERGPRAARWAFAGTELGRLRALSDMVKALNAEELVLAQGPDEWLGGASDVELVGARLVIVPDGFWFEARDRQDAGEIETGFVDLARLEAALAAASDVYLPDTRAVRDLVAECVAGLANDGSRWSVGGGTPAGRRTLRPQVRAR